MKLLRSIHSSNKYGPTVLEIYEGFGYEAANFPMNEEVSKIINRWPHATFEWQYNATQGIINNAQKLHFNPIRVNLVKIINREFAIYKDAEGKTYGVSTQAFDAPDKIKHSFEDNQTIVLKDYNKTEKGLRAILWSLLPEKEAELLHILRAARAYNI